MVFFFVYFNLTQKRGTYDRLNLLNFKIGLFSYSSY